MLATLLLPSLAMAQTDNIATVTVTKWFSDNNPATVPVHLSCFGGSTLDQDKNISQSQSVTFNVVDPAPGTNCFVTEGSAPGYSPQYSEECEITDIDVEEDYVCEIDNYLDAVVGTVFKEWVIEGDGGDAIDGDYKIKVYCDSFIFDYDYSNGYYVKKFHVYNDTGPKAFTFGVLPNWNGGTHCWAQEEAYDSSVEQSSSCGHSIDYAGILLTVGSAGDDCTITNTVFYEGIPTLSHYGLAILALTMLGLGVAGFRRYS